MPQKRLSDTITHVTLNTINIVVVLTLNFIKYSIEAKFYFSFFIPIFSPDANINTFYISTT